MNFLFFPGSSLPPRRQGSLLLLLVEWRSLTATGPALLPWERSEGDLKSRNVVFLLTILSSGIRSRLSCWFASSPSSGWSARLPRTSRPTWGSRALPWWPCKKPAKPTLSVSSRILTFVWVPLFYSRNCARIRQIPACRPSMPRGWPSCPRTSSWPGESGAKGRDPTSGCTRSF